MKRFFDLLLAALGLLVTSPAWILACFIILCSDPGRVFFKQARVGKAGQLFAVFKFRTMYMDPAQGKSVTTRDDVRVFPGGHFLRKYKLDELPQLLNVLNGSMSLVGPRPTVQEDFRRMDARQRRRFDVRPGVTGLAQISGNTALPWGKRIEYDLDYIDNQTLWLDIKILARTVLLVVTGRAETHPLGEDEWEEH